MKNHSLPLLENVMLEEESNIVRAFIAVVTNAFDVDPTHLESIFNYKYFFFYSLFLFKIDLLDIHYDNLIYSIVLCH